MKTATFNRLHELRMANDEARYAQGDLKPRFDRMAGRHENGTAPRAVSAFQLFQTPKEIAARLVSAAGISRSCRILEPSAGMGRILDAIGSAGGWDVTAVEVAANLAGELYRQERSGLKIIQRDFLTVTPSEIGFFDSVAMNPPFHMRSDIRHIMHALKFLKPGGKLAALCLDTFHREKALKPLAETWEKLPSGTFSKEGTQVATVLFTIMDKSRS
jgi:predicted RNA methylase